MASCNEQLGILYRGYANLPSANNRRVKKRKRKTVGEIIAELSQYPKDAFAYAYEGEVTGIVIIGKTPKKGLKTELGVVETSESDN